MGLNHHDMCLWPKACAGVAHRREKDKKGLSEVKFSDLVILGHAGLSLSTRAATDR